MNNLLLLLFVMIVFLSTGFKKHKPEKQSEESKWTGSVSFHQKRTGSKIVRDDWWMIATISNNRGNGLDSSIYENTDGDKARCATNAATELSLGIDKQTGEYDISVDIPGCYGMKTDRYGKTDSFGLCDETAILIEGQRTDPNTSTLKGTLRVVEGPDASGYTVITTHEWNLKKVK